MLIAEQQFGRIIAYLDLAKFVIEPPNLLAANTNHNTQTGESVAVLTINP